MKDKPCDIPYCGVREAKIKSAKPVLDQQIVKWSYEWMHDRYQIHVKKDVQRLPAPWTNNPILRQVKFCNVRREHDRQSLNLINNIVKNDALSMADKMFNCVLFRMFNLWDPIKVALEGAMTISDFAKINLDETRARLQKFEADGGKVFTNAFNTGGLKQCLAFPELVVNHKEQRFGGMMVNLICKDGSTQNMDYKEAKAIAEAEPDFYTIEGWEPYMPMRVIRSLKAFVNKYPNYFHDLLRLGTPLEVYQRMYGDIEGLGPFLAYQIWVDFTYIPEYPFSENHFTIAGPGCRAGIDLMFLNKDGMTYEECIFWVRDNQDSIFGPLGYNRKEFWSAEEPYDKVWNLQSIENFFCEIQKYVRCVEALQQGKKPRGKVGYNGGEVNQPLQKTPVRSINLLEKMKK
ncbi:hypothetical protein HYQ37_gp049 [Salmonella phage pertopsoe]|uniref:5-hmdU DNA kinase helical domain-containing protein n=1 Tax=Salmonella phage pertopsoe TaxID=2713310 RepID=A0A6G8RP99_9CAUD|nr:hypothetical protein HYQ37_gp049 [Salmonella phage pertopsoe]QIO03254.1 hypothetical protein pertopsoe_49 [Salmonella phage pertopsoe]